MIGNLPGGREGMDATTTRTLAAAAAAEASRAAPHAPRLAVLDVLRGVAIIGTLATNLWIFSSAEDSFGVMFRQRDWLASLDDLLQGLVFFLSNGKFLSLLAILFGVGLQIQHQHCRDRQAPWLRRLFARHVLLLVEGMLHFLLVFEYDILIGYALAGWFVGLFMGRGRGALWAMVAVGSLVHLAFFSLVAATEDFAGAARHFAAQDGLGALQASGGYLAQVAYRWEHFWFYRQEALMVLPLNLALFSVGALLWRSGAFEPTAGGARIRTWLTVLGLGLGGTASLVMFSGMDSGLFVARYLCAPLVAVGYLGLLAGLVLGMARRRTWVDGLAAIGRVALSAYVLQNILCSVIFFGWGIGLKGQLGAPATLGVLLGLAVLLAVLAQAWLRRFPRGPLELVTHRLMRAAGG